MKKIYLVDVSSIFFRSFYAIRQLSNSQGMPTNALYGFLVAIIKLLKEHKPDFIAFCFDHPEDGFREEIYKEYKANRDEAPKDLVVQFPYLPKIADALSIATFEKAGFEADDLIGTLSRLAKSQGQEVTIVSGDKDFAQLVEPGIRIFDPSKDAYMGADEVRAKFGVNPDQIIDYLALVGDSSDNVPGVRGVGPKAAQKLLGEFGTLKNVYDKLGDIKNDRLRELMSTQKEMAFLSQKLVTIVTDVPVEFSEDIIRVRPPKNDVLTSLLQELEFKTLLQRLLGEGASIQPVVQSPLSTPVSTDNTSEVEIKGQKELPEISFSKTTDVAQLETEFQKELKQASQSELWCEASPTGLAFAVGRVGFHFEGGIQQVNDWVAAFLNSTGIAFSGFDTKSMAHLLDLPGEAFKKIGSDVMLQAYCLGHVGEIDFKTLLKVHLEKDFPELASPVDRLILARELSNRLQSLLTDIDSNKILKTIEYPLAPVLYRMERAGVLLDRKALVEYSAELKSQTRQLEKEIFEMAGVEFNVGSPKQLGQILFEKLKLPVVRKTKTGMSTDSDVLEKLREHHPIAEKLLQWRELTKLNSTYVEALPQLIHDKSGRVHTRYNQAVAATGRLSSTNPNLQNIPIRTARGQRIRNSFIAKDGFKILSADYSQVELRILAHITQDENLMQGFAKDLDIHSATASEVFNIPLTEVSSAHRRVAKAINFGIAYGMSEFGLAENLQIARGVAAEFIRKYFARFPGVKKYMSDIVKEGMEQGYVQTIFGRRRYYDGLKSSNRNIRQAAERAAINMPIQGAAADIIKLAMIKIDAEISEECPKASMIMQVHDELVFEVPESQVDNLKMKIQTWMGETTKLSVPLKVDVEVGDHW